MIGKNKMPKGKYKRSQEIKDNLSKHAKKNPLKRCEICGAFLNKEGKCHHFHSDKHRIYKRNCNFCGEYYEGRGEKYCGKSCQGKASTGKRHWHWNGGRIKDKQGYILIYQPHHPQSNRKGYIKEHRLIMEKKLKRFLTKEEVVHHKNEVKDDNRLKNLQLFYSKSAHAKYHHPKGIKIGGKDA